jgi:hypothetical protein
MQISCPDADVAQNKNARWTQLGASSGQIFQSEGDGVERAGLGTMTLELLLAPDHLFFNFIQNEVYGRLHIGVFLLGMDAQLVAGEADLSNAPKFLRP